MSGCMYIAPQEQQVYERMPVPFAVLWTDRNSVQLLAASDGLCSAFQVERSDLEKGLTEILKKHIPGDDLDRLRSDLESAYLDPDGKYSASFRLLVSEGRCRWVSAKGRILRREDGSCLLYACCEDIQDEKEMPRIEAADKIRQDILLSRILSTTKTAIFWKDANRRFLGVNKAFLDYYGFPDDGALIGRNDEEMGWHTDPDPYRNDELRVLRDGISTFRVPGKCIARGVNREIVSSKSPLIVNGKIVGLVGSFEDVTRETRQQEEIQRLNEQLKKQIRDRDLLMSISEVCIVKIRLSDFVILEYNDAMCRMIGCTRQEFDERYQGRMEQYFAGRYRSELDGLKKSAEDALAAGRRQFNVNMRIPHDGTFTWIGGAVSFTDPAADGGRPEAMYAVYRDITDMIEAQKELELAEIEIEKSRALQEQMERMRRMIDGVPSGLGALRIEKGIPQETMQLNQYFIDRIDVQVSKENAVNLAAFLECIHPEDRERCSLDFHAFLSRKMAAEQQYRLRCRDGKYLWESVRGTIARLNEDTEIAYFIYSNIDDIRNAEEKLRESRYFYQEVVQGAKLSTWDYDIENRRITMSADTRTRDRCAMLALPAVIDHVPESMIHLVAEEDRPAFLNLYEQVNQGLNASCEVWYNPRNGSEPRCERITYIALKNSDGKPVKAIGFSQNVTADRKVEERYQREVGYLRQADDNNLVAKGHYNLTRNTVLEYTTKNDTVFRVQPGTAYEDAVNAMAAMSFQEEDRTEIIRKLNRGSLVENYQHGQMQSSLIYRQARSGELPLWISMNIHTYMMPETGDLECFTYAYDVSSKMEMDEIMGLISEEQFDYIALIYAESNEFEYIKKSHDYGYSGTRERISYAVGMEYVLRSFINEDERADYEKAVSIDRILAALAEHDGRYVTTYHRNENGRVLCKQLDYVWINREEKIILSVRSDVTAAFERNQQQLAQIREAKLEADRANEAKSSFLSSMSHDIRTPLNGVIGFTDLALRETDPDRKQEYLKKIDSSGHLLLDLVNDTLELSRIESGKMTLEPEAVMPDELIPAVVTALRPSAELKGIRLDASFENDASKPVWCDRLKVQKIALNLISNSIKYTPEGGTVSVHMIPSSNPKLSAWSLCVEDTGIGMSEEFMKRMFEPFAQEKRSESLKTPGTGLGLAIVKRYVDLMGGTIEVESRIHRGTRWVVTLPISEVPDASVRKREQREKEYLLSGRRVLLCEDNFMNTEIAVMLLKEKGVEVDAAENGQEGLDRFSASAEGYYDAILMDLRMPVMDGNTASRRIRMLDRQDAHRIPIIAMTADAFEESVREAMEAGMNGYVTKPVEPGRLFSELAEQIQTSQDACRND